MYDVYFYEVFAEELASLKHYLPSSWHCGFTEKTIQESGDAVPPSAIISIRTQSLLPSSWSEHLKGILSRSAGFDHLTRFLETCDRPVSTGHLFAYSGRAVAEHAAMLWMALLRRLPVQQKAMPRFHRDDLTGRECRDRTLAVFGVGDIGYQAVLIGRGLGMKVLGVDPVHRHADVVYVDKESAIAGADVAVCAMNLNETNQGYFSNRHLALLPRGSVFVNVARGEFATCADLLDQLEKGHLGGVGLDVYSGESILSPALRSGTFLDHPEYIALQKLLARDDVILTPHNAFNTQEAVARKSEQSVRQLRHFFTHGVFAPAAIEET